MPTVNRHLSAVLLCGVASALLVVGPAAAQPACRYCSKANTNSLPSLLIMSGNA
jgi:hypothetical protein